MKVILTMDVAEVGTRGDVVDVAAGFARNYLIPRRLAVYETVGNLRILEEEGRLTSVRDKKALQEAKKIQEYLAAHELFTTLKIGREGKAFGAVTAKDIGILLRKAGMEVDRRRIRLDSPIKRLGVFEVPLAVHSEVDTLIKLFIDREGGTKEGAVKHQDAFDEKEKVREEAARQEAEERAQREKEAEEAAELAIQKAAERRAREEEAKAERERKEAEVRAAEGGTPATDAGAAGGEPSEEAPGTPAETS